MSEAEYIDDRILRFLEGEASPEEEAELTRWRAADPEHEARYRRVKRIWELTGAALPRRVDSSPPKIAQLIASASGDTEDRTIRDASSRGQSMAWEERPPMTSRAPAWRRGGMVAAVIASVLAFGVGTFVERQRSVVPSLETTEVTTGAGELTTVTLSDGTAVRVGPQSRLQVFRRGEERAVELDGRAFFSVSPDQARQFVVRTRFGDASALGTRFEVRTERREFRVLVVEGSVRVSAEGSDVDMDAGMMSRSADGEAPTTTRIDDPGELLAWMGRSLLFRSTPLPEAMREIERQYGVEVELEDSRLMDLHVTATFTDEELESVVSVICGAIGADCSVDGDSVRVDPPPPDPASRPSSRIPEQRVENVREVALNR